MQIQTLTFEQLVGAVAVFLLLLGIYNTAMTALKNWREEKKRTTQPMSNLETTVREHGEMLDKDHVRLNELEESNRIIMRALMAMLSHEINGNSDDKLRESFDEIQKYLIEK